MSVTSPVTRAARLSTIDQVARRLHVRPSYVLRLIRRKDLAGVRVGRYWRVRPEDLEAYIDGHRQASKDEEPAPVDDRQLSLDLAEEEAALVDGLQALGKLEALAERQAKAKAEGAAPIDPDDVPF